MSIKQPYFRQVKACFEIWLLPITPKSYLSTLLLFLNIVMESNIQNFFPPDALIKLIPQMGVVNLTTNYTDYVDQLPTPNLPYEGVTDKKVIEEIKSLQSTAIDHLAIAKDHANQFFSNVRPEVLDAYDDLLHFSIGTDVNYDYNFISLHYNDPAKQKTVLKALNMIKSTADRYLGDVKNAIAGVSTFNQNLSQDHAQFKKDYEEVKKDISDVSNIVTEIENKITALQAKIGDNNQKVAETAIEEGLDLVENGITLASDIADENVGDAIKTGAVLAYKFIKADITIILMEVEIIKLIREISALQQQLTLVENDLVILNNLGSIFSSLSDGGDFSFATLDGLSNYWEGLSAYMESLINGIGHGPTVNMVDPAIILKSWKETVHDVLSPFVDPDIVPPMPSIYQEGKNVKFDSLDNIGKYK